MDAEPAAQRSLADRAAERDELERQIEQLTVERDALFRESERLAFTILGRSYARDLEPYRRDIDSLRAELELAQGTIRNMERSWFWRARLVWVRWRRRVHPG